jgi:hypothetical protein
MDTKKLKMHLEAALACLDGGEGEVEEMSTAPESDDEGDDMPMKSMKMTLGKYKG